MVIGGRIVYPELNFTLPVMTIDRTTLPGIRDQYRRIIVEAAGRAAALGVELLSIESVGGKELHDEALTLCDLPQVIFSLCVLGVRDMKFLWTATGRLGCFATGWFAPTLDSIPRRAC